MPRKFRLQVRSEDKSLERTLDVSEGSATLGRSAEGPECQLRLDRPNISRLHARVSYGFVLEDLGSRNGTFVDGKRVSGAILLTGREFRLGEADGAKSVVVRVEELQASEAEPRVAGDIERLQAELQRVQRERDELERQLRAGPAKVTLESRSPAAALIERLSRENAELRRRVEELDGKAPAPQARPEPPNRAGLPSPRPMNSLERPERELGAPRPMGHAARPGPSIPGSVTRPGPSDASFLRKLITEDPAVFPPGQPARAEDFVLSQQYMCFRNFERVITRVASGISEIMNEHTVMPGTGGENFRALAGQLLATPADASVRGRLIDYSISLNRWLAVATQSQQIAALRLLTELREEFSETALIGDRPLRGGPFASPRSGLWDRAQAHWQSLTESLLQERLTRLVQQEARQLLQQGHSD